VQGDGQDNEIMITHRNVKLHTSVRRIDTVLCFTMHRVVGNSYLYIAADIL
jgi:hypothetical protein